MSFASKTGRALGRAAGWTAATAFKGAVIACEAGGEFGAACYEGATESFDERCAAMDAKREERKAKLLALKAAQAAGAQAPAAITVVAA